MSPNEEEYLHSVTCADALNRAWKLLKHIRDQEAKNNLAGAAFQYALVEYCKPFKYSRGIHKPGTRSHPGYRLESGLVPKEFRSLHDRVVDKRDTFHAHSDLTILDARVWVTKIKERKLPGYVQNAISGLEEWSNIGALVAMIEGVLENLYKKIEELGNQLS